MQLGIQLPIRGSVAGSRVSLEGNVASSFVMTVTSGDGETASLTLNQLDIGNLIEALQKTQDTRY